MTNTAKKTTNTAKKTTPKVEEKRTKEETANLKREFFLNFNSYTVKSYKDAVLDKLHNHMFQGDGDYLVVNNKIGNFIVKMKDAETERPGLPMDFNGHKIELKVPRIPSKIYYEILAFFRSIADKMNNAEAFVQVYFDLQKNEYICNIPEQIVSGTSVKYDAEKNLNNINRKRYIFVFEIHSHNNMGAFWSLTDNADEKETKFYGVFGKIKEEKIEEKFRFMAMGKYIDLPKEILFDFDEEKTIDKEKVLAYLNDKKDIKYINKNDLLYLIKNKPSTHFPIEWLAQVKKPLVVSTPQYQQQGRRWDNQISPSAFQEDPWEELQHDRNFKSFGKKEKTEDEVLSLDIEDTFDLDSYEMESRPIIIASLVESMIEQDVSILLEELVDNGHDHLIQSFRR